MPDELDLRIIRALESAPPVHIPPDFAARISRVPHPREARVGFDTTTIPAPRVGIWTVRIALAILLVAMFVFAPRAFSHRAIPLTIELLLTGEFVALTAWAGLNPRFIR